MGGEVSIDSSLNIQFYQVPKILVLIKNLIHHNERELKIFTCDYASLWEKFEIGMTENQFNDDLLMSCRTFIYFSKRNFMKFFEKNH